MVPQPLRRQPQPQPASRAARRRFPFSWNPGHGSRLGFVPREGEAADMVWVDVPISYVFHPMNASDQADGSVVIGLCVYDTMFDKDVRGPFGDDFARLERWVVNPVTRTCSTTVIDGSRVEFPRHRGALTGKPYRYGYCAGLSLEPGWPTLKYDLHTGEKSVFGAGLRPADSRPRAVAPASTVRLSRQLGQRP